MDQPNPAGPPFIIFALMPRFTIIIALLFAVIIRSDGQVTYLDAAPANTTLTDGSPYTPTATLINDDNQWSLRTLANLGTVYTANDNNANPGEDAPMLRATMSGLVPGAAYDVFVYFWGAGNDAPAGNQRWDILAGLSPGALEFFDTGSAINLGHATTGVDPFTHFTNQSPTVLLSENDRRLYQARLGTATADANGRINVFVDDAPGNVQRTWFDGIGWKPAETTTPEPPGPVREVAPDGAWTWFNDERAIWHQGLLFVGYVLRDGRYGVTRYHDGTDSAGHAVVSTNASRQQNDHNNPSLTVLPDGSLLTVYSKHSSEPRFYHRRSLGPLPAASDDWGPEMSHTMPANNTYSNTFRLAGENDLILNFTRTINWNPTVTISTDDGATWGTPVHFINAGSGNTRPYPKYSSNDHDRVDLIYSDGHPRDVNNSIYHLFYRDGFLRHTDGSTVRAFADLPLRFNEGERGAVVYPFSAAAWSPEQGPDDWIPGARAWTWDVHLDTNGHPVCVFQVQLDNVTGTGWNHDRIYYYYARWTGSEWQRRFIAHGGRGLYQAEDDYGGGVAIDPDDPRVIYISTNAASPFALGDIQNVPLAVNERYEIWRGFTADGGLSFSWEPVTENSAADNLRPIVPKGHGMSHHALWFQGTYTSYTQFNTRVMGLFDPQAEPAGYAAWAASSGLAKDSLMDDADGDGLVNLLEYALGGDPLDPADRPAPTWRDGAFHFRHDSALPDIDWRVEWSDDLVLWHPAATAGSGQPPTTMPGFTLTTNEDTGELILHKDPADDRIFMRIRITFIP